MTNWSRSSALSREGSVTIRKVASEDAADGDAVKITLFRSPDAGACGWFIGPLSITPGRVSIPYLPKSEQTMASVAVVRAVRAAEETGSAVCLIDPDDLWTAAWRS